MITNYAANKLVNLITGRASSAVFGTSIYVGLSLNANVPLANGTGYLEPSGNGYARVLLGNPSQELTQKMTAAAAGASENDEIVFFPEATGAWGVCGYFLIFDNASAGNLLAFGNLVDGSGDPTTISPVSNTVPLIRVGELEVTLT